MNHVYEKISRCERYSYYMIGQIIKFQDYYDFIANYHYITYTAIHDEVKYYFHVASVTEFVNQFSETCDTCDINFSVENAVMCVIDSNKQYIKKECVNCRKFAMNSDFVMDEFNEKKKVIMKEYLSLINSGNFNINVLIISYLFGENNSRMLY